MARDRISYAWALKVPEQAGSADGGLALARLLAEQALEWRREAPRGNPRPYPLTAEELAQELELDPAIVAERIAQARYVAFGSLSDSGIYAKLARERGRGEEEESPSCKAPDCDNKLPRRRSVRREYCHARCRRRHHYQRQHPDPRPAPHLRGARGGGPEPLSLTQAELERVLDAIARIQREDDEEE
ncbi:MAG TPA: hypothetical protein VNB06_08575 [Thermoanaerobaculia bacterium]|nr:hypothetical protein [Thermoanaerobaculia bacterium]